jgi:hypothetical protein
MQASRSRSRMGSLRHPRSPEENYVRLQGRRGRRRGFRLCPRNRFFSVRRLRVELLTFLGLVGRYVRLLVRKLSASSGGGGGAGCARRTGSRRVLVVTTTTTAGKKYKAPAPAPIVRSNSFYSQAIADCLEFIKRNSVPAEDYGSLSARR